MLFRSHNGSSYSSSGASNSCPSNNSGSSGGAAPVFAALEENDVLMKIAHQMVNDEYVWHMVQAFADASPAPALKFGGSPDHALKNWFSELDVDWVLQIHDEHGLRRLLRDKPETTTQDLVEKWIRALIVITASITKLVCAFPHRATAVALFGKASITKLLDVVDVIITVLETEKLRAVLDMFTCVCGVSHIFTPVLISPKHPSVLNELGGMLERQGNRLSEVISSTMEEVRKLVEEDDSWAIEILRGGGEVHNNTRFIMDCIVSMSNAWTSMGSPALRCNFGNLDSLIYRTIGYLKGLLYTKSGSCSDQSLRKYMDSYLDVSWGHVLSCIPKSRFPGPIHRWINTSSLVKFESAFHKTYQTQKLWKVPDPELRDALRMAITERVISGYRDYLEEHPELGKHVGCQSSSPEVLEGMLGELFEG